MPDREPEPYWHTEGNFHQVVSEIAAPASREIVATVQAILTAFAKQEPTFQVPCDRALKLIAEIRAFAEARTGYSPLAMFYATRILTRLRYDRFAIYSPSLALGIGDGLASAFALNGRRMSVGSDFLAHEVPVAEKTGCFDRVEQIDMQAIPYPDGHFRTVTADNALYHVADKRAALREIARVLAPSGEAHFDDLSAQALTIRPLAELLRAMGFERGASTVLHAQTRRQETWTADEYRDVLCGLGFDRVEVRPMLSPMLFRAAYLPYDLVRLVGQGDDADALSAYLDAVIAPLLEQDERLCAQHGGTYWSVSARKS